MLSEAQIEQAAAELYEAERVRRQIRPLTLTYPDVDLNDAYAVQNRWVERKILGGDKVIGYKIGLTSRAMQMSMNIDEPDFGVLLESMRIENGAAIRGADYMDPRVEAEFAFVLKKRLFGEDVTLEQVLDATDYVMPALELIDARSFRVDPETGYTRKVHDTIADNAANSGIVCGDVHVQPSSIDLRWAGALLYLNGTIEETGLGAGVLDHPGHGIRWVCKRFAPHGIALEAGQTILSGSFTRPVPLRPGDHIEADYGDLGRLAISCV